MQEDLLQLIKIIHTDVKETKEMVRHQNSRIRKLEASKSFDRGVAALFCFTLTIAASVLTYTIL